MEKINWSDILKFSAYALVLAIYGAFAWTGKAAVEGYLNVLTAVITAHGATHIARAVRDGSGKPKSTNAGETANSPLTNTAQAGFANPVLLAVIAVFASVFLLCGCATPGQAPIALQTPAQVAAQACPQVQVALDALQGLPDLPQQTQTDLALAVTLTGAVCAIGAIPTQANLQSLAKDALPAIANIVKASSLAIADQNRIKLGLDAAQIVLVAAANATSPQTSTAATVSP
jgi:hypothetical protein